MSDPYVQKLDTVVDIHGRALEVGVNYDAVTVGVYDFSSTQYEELSHLLVQATWLAAANSERMRQEADGEAPDVDWAVGDFESWLRLLDLGPIFDEYRREIPREQLLAMIENKRGGESTLYSDDFRDADGNRFINREFS